MDTYVLIFCVHVYVFSCQTLQGFLQYLYRLLMDWGKLLVFWSFRPMKLSHAGLICSPVKKRAIQSMCMHYGWA